MKEIIATVDTYWICHNNVDIIHCINLKQGNKLLTGQPFVEERSSYEEVKARVNQIARDQTYFDVHFAYITR